MSVCVFLVVVRAFFMEALKRVDRRQNEVFKWREKAGVRRMLVTVNNTLLCGGGGRFLYESLNNIPLYRPSPLSLSLWHTQLLGFVWYVCPHKEIALQHISELADNAKHRDI